MQENNSSHAFLQLQTFSWLIAFQKQIHFLKFHWKDWWLNVVHFRSGSNGARSRSFKRLSFSKTKVHFFDCTEYLCHDNRNSSSQFWILQNQIRRLTELNWSWDVHSWSSDWRLLLHVLHAGLVSDCLNCLCVWQEMHSWNSPRVCLRGFKHAQYHSLWRTIELPFNQQHRLLYKCCFCSSFEFCLLAPYGILGN